MKPPIYYFIFSLHPWNKSRFQQNLGFSEFSYLRKAVRVILLFPFPCQGFVLPAPFSDTTQNQDDLLHSRGSLSSQPLTDVIVVSIIPDITWQPLSIAIWAMLQRRF